MHQDTHNAAAHVAILLTTRLLSAVVNAGIMSRKEVVAFLDTSIADMKRGGPVNQEAANLIEQIKATYVVDA